MVDTAPDPDPTSPSGESADTARSSWLRRAWTLLPLAVFGVLANVAQVVSVIAEKQYSTLLTSLGVVAALAAAALAFDLWRRRRTLPRPDTEKLLGILIHVCVALSTLSAVALVSVLLLATRPPEPDDVVRTDTVGRATLSAEPNSPGGCSSTFHLTGEIEAFPSAGKSFWIVAVLNADPANGLKDTLFYPKTRIEVRLGKFEIDMSGNTTPGSRSGRYVLVSANERADAELLLSRKSDVEQDYEIYPDGRRVQLPTGADEIARTDELEQSC